MRYYHMLRYNLIADPEKFAEYLLNLGVSGIIGDGCRARYFASLAILDIGDPATFGWMGMKSLISIEMAPKTVMHSNPL